MPPDFHINSITQEVVKADDVPEAMKPLAEFSDMDMLLKINVTTQEDLIAVGAVRADKQHAAFNNPQLYVHPGYQYNDHALYTDLGVRLGNPETITTNMVPLPHSLYNKLPVYWTDIQVTPDIEKNSAYQKEVSADKGITYTFYLPLRALYPKGKDTIQLKRTQYLANSGKMVTGFAGNQVYDLMHYPAGLNCRLHMLNDASEYFFLDASPASIVISREELVKALHKAGLAAN